MKFFEKRVQPRTRHRIQVRFGADGQVAPGFITDVSNTGMALLCREKPLTRVLSMELSYENITATLACEVRWTETVQVKGRNLTHMGLKIMSAPLAYLEIVKRIESKVPVVKSGELPDSETSETATASSE